MRHRLRLALEVSHCGVAEMADELGVARNTVSNYLSGRSTPTRGTLRVWAIRTGVPFEWLQTGQVSEGGGGAHITPVTMRYRQFSAA